MFGFFKKSKSKSKIQQLIDERGYEGAVLVAAGSVVERIPNRAAAYEFILQELDGASMGNERSRQAASSSGIPSSDYNGALKNDAPAIEAAQDHILNYSMQLASDRELMARFRVDIALEVMKRFEFGRFSPPAGTPDRPPSQEDQDEVENFIITPGGFTVRDLATGDVLQAAVREGLFHATITMKSTGMSAALAPWPLRSNPFDDELNFSGSGNGPAGPWEFSVTPSIPFEEILEMARATAPLADDAQKSAGGGVASIKAGAARIVARLALEQGATVSEVDMRSLVENVAANIGERDIGMAGELVLAMASLTSITANSIDQGDIEMANVYFACVMAGFDTCVRGHEDALSAYQTKALRTIFQEFASVKDELVAANGT